MSCSDPYQVLMLERGATAQEVRAAFRALIRQWHPDVAVSPEAHRRSAAIIQAYRALSRPERRSLPDRRHRVPTSRDAQERRRGERRSPRPRPGGLSRRWRAATLAWAIVAGLTVTSTVITEWSAGRTDEIAWGARSS